MFWGRCLIVGVGAGGSEAGVEEELEELDTGVLDIIAVEARVD